MRKSTLIAVVLTAVFIAVGWIWFDSIGIYFLISASLTAVVALISAFTKGKE